jgi:hypothetical protein
MKKMGTLCFFVLVVATAWGSAQEIRPVAVSPGSESGLAVVGQLCPTFSWTAVDWAAGYRVIVFETATTEVQAYEAMAAIAAPILSKEIRGRASSWTPSSAEQLQTSGLYIWYVQAMDYSGQGMWSTGRVFTVDSGVWPAGIEERVRKSLRAKGLAENVIDEVLRDIKAEVKEGDVSQEDANDGIRTQDKTGIQGLEGTNNTFYGAGAGASTTGWYNGFFGANAGHSNTTGFCNTFLGHYCGYANISGNCNTFVGGSAGNLNTIGYNNTFLGYESGFKNEGRNNIFIGMRAGYNNIAGYDNTFVGGSAGYNNEDGMYNTFVGYAAGFSNDSGYYNTFLGDNAGYSNTTGDQNTFLGQSAGRYNTAGNQNVFLGWTAGQNEHGSNKLYISNSSTGFPLIYGEFDNGILGINGKLGIGTKSPATNMELETTGENAIFLIDRTDGATIYFAAKAGMVNFGSSTTHPVRFVVGGGVKMSLNTDGSLDMSSGARCTAGGTWQNSSSRQLKENIKGLTADEAMEALGGLEPVKFNYKADKEEQHVGFIAEDVPDLVATKDRKGLSPMDVVAVLTKVVQDQQNILEEQQKAIDELSRQIAELKQKTNFAKNIERNLDK